VSTRPPITVGEPEWDRGLWWMVLASGGLHLAAIAFLLLTPHTFLHHPPPMISYTVDLIAPDKVGGTNLIRGGKGRVDAPPMAAAPAPKIEEPKPPPKSEPKPPAPPKVEPPKPAPEAVAKAAAPPAPPPEPPKVEEKPKGDELALAVKTIEPPTVAPPAPTAQSQAAATAPPQPTPSPTVDAQATKAVEEARAAAAKAVKEAAEAKAAKEAAEAKAAKEVAEAKAAKAAAEAKAAKEVAEAKAAKAAAEAKAAKEAAQAKAAKAAADAKAAKEAADAKDRDNRIAAAIRRVEQQAGARGGGTGSAPGDQSGGSVSIGPGEGAGGVVKGVEYLLYRNQLEARIKQNWAWAGAARSLEAAVHFSITESGEVTDVRITKSSGDRAYDASVERAVRAVNPLPPPPEPYRKEFSDVEYTFSPESLQM
jgi:colicin import membrane protein